MLIFTTLSLLLGTLLLLIEAITDFLFRLVSFYPDNNIIVPITNYGALTIFFISFILSLINLFISKRTERNTYIFLLFISSALFFATLSWNVNWNWIVTTIQNYL